MLASINRWVTGFKLSTLLILLALAGVSNEGLKFVSKQVARKCSSLEMTVARKEIESGFAALQARLLASRIDEEAYRLDKLPQGDSKSLEIANDLEARRAEVRDIIGDVDKQRQEILPALRKNSAEICNDVEIADAAANMLAGIYAVGIAFFLFYLGLFVTYSSVRPAPAPKAESTVESEKVEDA